MMMEVTPSYISLYSGGGTTKQTPKPVPIWWLLLGNNSITKKISHLITIVLSSLVLLVFIYWNIAYLPSILLEDFDYECDKSRWVDAST